MKMYAHSVFTDLLYGSINVYMVDKCKRMAAVTPHGRIDACRA